MAQIKIELSEYIRQAVDHVAARSGKSRTATIERLLYQIELLAQNDKLPQVIGLDFIEAFSLLNAKGFAAKHLDPVHQDGGEHIAFDVTLLEKSAKSKTSYAGVHATSGGSFRALVPDVETGGSRYLASRPTALRAAIDRYEWFKKYNLPYGNLGWHVADLKTKHPEWSDEQCLEHLQLFLADGNAYGMKNPVTLEEVEQALASITERDLKPTTPITIEPESTTPAPLPPPPEPPPSRLMSVPDVVRCAICKEEIESGEPFGPHGKTDYAHAGCLTS